MTFTQQADGSLYADVLDHGHIKLERVSGTELDIINSARVSFNDESDEMDERNEGLINFLMRERHGTPFEAPTLHFDVKLPLFVTREWHRHRVGWSYNEWSARYSKIEPEFYVPSRDDMREQKGKPGAYHYERIEEDGRAEANMDLIEATARYAFDRYDDMLADGVAKEIARLVLPVNMFTRMKASCNLRSLMHFLGLRNHPQAQREIRYYAEIMEAMAMEHFPVSMSRFIEHGRKSP